MTLYDTFVQKLWIENCIERDSVGDPVLSKKDYISRFADFIKDEWEESDES